MFIALSYPVTTSRRAEFGRRGPGRGRFVPGLDLFVPYGTPVRAAGAGVVSQVGPAGPAGNVVTVAHAPGIETSYAHLGRVLVLPGQAVAPGAVIGQAGNSGSATTPRVHFAVRVGGRLVNPDEAVALGVESYASGLVAGGLRPDGAVNYHVARQNFLEWGFLIVLAIAAGFFD